MGRNKITLDTLREKKANGEKMPRTALYDYPMAVLAEEAGIEIINVGDSIANIVFGHATTVKANLDTMVEHARAVRKGAPTAYIMGDMPFLSYQCSISEAIRNAGRYIVEADMDCVKVEGGLEVVPVIQALTKAGIPVIGHTGLTPQSSIMLGGFKTQGRSCDAALKIIETVAGLEEAGCVAIVVESVPSEVARIIYERTDVPFLGTGCGPYCDSPMINWYDLLGFYTKVPRFAKRYADARQYLLDGGRAFVEDVRSGGYPGAENCYAMLPGEEEKLLLALGMSV